MILRLDPISLTALILLAILVGLNLYDRAEPEQRPDPAELASLQNTRLVVYDQNGRKHTYACLGETIDAWVCRPIKKETH